MARIEKELFHYEKKEYVGTGKSVELTKGENLFMKIYIVIFIVGFFIFVIPSFYTENFLSMGIYLAVFIISMFVVGGVMFARHRNDSPEEDDTTTVTESYDKEV